MNPDFIGNKVSGVRFPRIAGSSTGVSPAAGRRSCPFDRPGNVGLVKFHTRSEKRMN